MIVRQLAPRQCRRAIFAHGSSPRFARRAYATEIEQNEALFTRQLNEAAAMAANQSGADVTPSEMQQQRARRRLPRQLDPVVEDYLTFKHMQSTSGRYGAATSGTYAPWTLLSNPPRPSDVTLELLLASQAHLGHSTALWNPANSRYIFGIREGIHIISLDVTAAHLRRAARIVTGVAERGGIILFVGTRPGFDRCVVRASQLSGGCHLFERWTPGGITNGQQILGRCKMKVIDEHDNEVSGFDHQLHDRSALKPDLVIVLNPLENKVLLSECALVNIPTIGIIDTDANPTWVTYPIPANDDSLRCVQVIAGVLGRAGQEGRQRRLHAARDGKITFLPTEGLQLPVDWDDRNAAENAAKADDADALPTPDDPRDLIQDPSIQRFAQSPEALLESLTEKLQPEELQAIQDGAVSDDELRALEGRLTPAEVEMLLLAFGEEPKDEDDIAEGEEMGVNASEEDVELDEVLLEGDGAKEEDDVEEGPSHVR